MKKVLLISLIPFRTFYALLLQISHFFFDKFHVYSISLDVNIIIIIVEGWSRWCLFFGISYQGNIREAVWHAKGISWPFRRKIQFCPKKTNKKYRKNGQLFGYADFGGCWTPTKWHQVNFFLRTNKDKRSNDGYA